MRLNSTHKAFRIFDGIKIMPGINEVKDEVFYKLMNLPTFKNRVFSQSLKVLDGFPLVKKIQVVENLQEEKENADVLSKMIGLSSKKAVKLIDEIDDLEALESLLSDDRSKVVDAAQAKIDLLKEEK